VENEIHDPRNNLYPYKRITRFSLEAQFLEDDIEIHPQLMREIKQSQQLTSVTHA